MTRRRVRDLQRMAEAEASRVGARLATLELTNGGHLRASFATRAGESKAVFLSSTPSDFRSDRSMLRCSCGIEGYADFQFANIAPEATGTS